MPRLRGNRWLADVRIDGRRLRKSFATKQEAEQFEQNPEGAAATLGAIYEEVYRRRWKGTKNERTAEINGDEVVSYFGRDTHPQDIDEREIDRFVSYLVEKGNAPATVNRKLAVLSVLLRFAYTRRFLPRLPHIERLREPKGRTRWLTREEAITLVNAFRPDDEVNRVLTRFLLATGCRMGEALKAQFRDLHNGRVSFTDTKNGHTRTIPLSADIEEAIKGLPRRGPHIFEGVTAGSYRHAFDKAKAEAQLGGDVVIHTLRHSVASWLVQEGVPLRAVQEFLGHRTLTMVMRYAHLCPTSLDQAASVLELRL